MGYRRIESGGGIENMNKELLLNIVGSVVGGFIVYFVVQSQMNNKKGDV